MELRPFRRDGQALAFGAVVGYVAILGSWIIIAEFSQDATLSGPYARAFTFLVLPPLLLIPVGLSLIVGILAQRCEGFDNEMRMLQLGAMFSIVFCTSAAAAMFAFFTTSGTVLYLQPHVLVTTLFCLTMAGGCGYILRVINGYRQSLPTAETGAFHA